MVVRSAPPVPLPELPVPATGDILARRCFRAMNTSIEITLADWRCGHLLDRAETVFHQVEDRFSRFRADSELSRFNNRSAIEFEASPAFIALLSRALEFHRLTDGMFDPAILPVLEAAGYDRSFELIDHAERGEAISHTDASSIGDVHIDDTGGTVAAPKGLRLDFGGIGKGYAVDLAARVLAPARHFMINAGGDIVASGDGPTREGWDVGVADPRDTSKNIEVVRVRDAAIATSSVAKRRWRRDGKWNTHIIDPRTRVSLESGVVTATVIAPTATEADVFAKTALLLGVDDGCAWVEQHAASALFVEAARGVVRTPSWPLA